MREAERFSEAMKQSVDLKQKIQQIALPGNDQKTTIMYNMDNLKKLVTLGKNVDSAMKAFQELDQAALAEGVIPKKYKELMAIAVALTAQCPYCLEIHKKYAIDAGATEEELAEVTFIAAALRAGAAVVHGTHLV